jgi:hypothetical protein
VRGRSQQLIERRTPDASKLGERMIKLGDLGAPRSHDALDISRRACAKLFGKIIQHTFERAFVSLNFCRSLAIASRMSLSTSARVMSSILSPRVDHELFEKLP